MSETQPIRFEPGAPEFSGPAGQTQKVIPYEINRSQIIFTDRLTGKPISDRDDSDAGITADIDTQSQAEIEQKNENKK
jgi:hypothetical protein